MTLNGDLKPVQGMEDKLKATLANFGIGIETNPGHIGNSYLYTLETIDNDFEMFTIELSQAVAPMV